MKRLLATLSFTVLIVSCVDTTGISPQSTRTPKGNPQSVVVVTEYADLECPACRAAHTTIALPLVQKYGNQIRYDFKHFPLRSIHRHTMELSEAAECAADQGKFWEFVDIAFERQPDLTKGAAQEWGEALVEDDSLFSRCVRSHIKSDTVMADYNEGVALDVLGTPSFFVNGAKVESTLDDVSAAIDAVLKGARQRL